MSGLNPLHGECPICGSTHIETVLQLPQIPVFCNNLWPDEARAVAAPRGDMQLTLCRDCGHLFNAAFDPGLMTYDQAYENSLHFSPRFQRYAHGLARSLVERYDLHGKDIIEIGCGQGDFLQMLCELGDNRGVGFDPSFVDEGHLPPSITVIPDYYGDEYRDYPADFLYARHVIEHLARPRDFATMLRRGLMHRPDAVIFIEAPDAGFMIKNAALWDIIYEHFSYFGRASMRRLFEDAGFDILGLYTTFGGQYLCLEAGARPDVRALDLAQEDWGAAIWQEEVMAFAARSMETMARWRERLAAMRAANQRIVVWGAGSKGVMFLNLLQPQSDVISYVVDINPRKHGMFVAGAGQQIVPPEFLRAYRPDAIIVMNRNYGDEIREMTAELGLSPTFQFV